MLDASCAPLVIVKGTAGTAKTFYALAVGLHKIIEQKVPAYRKILISRPNIQFDEDIGFLPGSEQDKIAPLLRPVIDNLEILVDRDEKQRYRDEKVLRGKIDELFDCGIIAAEAMNFIRGRSITHTYLIIDEAQNLTPKQVKGIITRIGFGTKVILLGDPEQIDHPLLDADEWAQLRSRKNEGVHSVGRSQCNQMNVRDRFLLWTQHSVCDGSRYPEIYN